MINFKFIIIFLIFNIYFLLFTILTVPVFAQTSTVPASFDKETVVVKKDEEFILKLRVKPSQDIQLRAYRIKADFDSKKLEVIDINYLKGRQSLILGGDGNDNLPQVNSRDPGLIMLVGEMATDKGERLGANQNIALLELTFKVKDATESQIKTDPSADNSHLKIIKSDLSINNLPITQAQAIINPAPPPPPPPPPTPPPPPERTICFVISEDKLQVDAITTIDTCQNIDGDFIRSYDSHPVRSNFTLKDLTKGKKFIFVKFISNKQVSKTFQAAVDFNPNPQITNVDCTHATSGVGTVVKVTGTNFGAKGPASHLKAKDQKTRIVSWKDNEIEAILDEQRLDGEIPVEVKTEDGRVAGGAKSCTIGVTTVQFTAKPQCKQPGQFAADNVDVKIFANIPQEEPQPLAAQKVKTNKDGLATGFTPKLEKTKKYSIIIKAPGTLARKADFETKIGTAGVEVTLPAGDIFPTQSPDGKINVPDRAELIRQWSLVRDVAKTGDFNQDTRVNSIDYACMRQNFNQSDEEFSPPTEAVSPLPVGVGTTSPTGIGTTTPVGVGTTSPPPAGGPSGILPFRVSFDPDFTTIAAPGDMGTNTVLTIDLTLPSGPGQKIVYVQFFENGVWTSSQTASILLK